MVENLNSDLMKRENQFSVLMAVYHKDSPELLYMALESVYANTLQPSNVVLVQDGPIGQNLSEVIAKYQARKNFSLIELPFNKGLANALNVGLNYIDTPFVFRADADDYNLPDRFERQLVALQAGYDLVGGAIVEVDKDGKSIAMRQVPISEDDIRSFISKRNPFNHMTVAYRRSTIVNVGGYPEIFLKEDYALWALMLANGAKVKNLSETLVHATAGVNMYKRRGGLRYARSEIDIQLFLIKCGLQSIQGAIFIGLLRAIVFLMPSYFRGFIYEKFLRNSV